MSRAVVKSPTEFKDSLPNTSDQKPKMGFDRERASKTSGSFLLCALYVLCEQNKQAQEVLSYNAPFRGGLRSFAWPAKVKKIQTVQPV